jgi:pimeloyl-ACP methyl ester carboxylesterase
MEHTITFAGQPVIWADRGSGAPALLFVHGALCDHHDWDAQLDAFCARHRVLAPDLPGHGASCKDPAAIGVKPYARMLRAACTALALDDVVLVGHSMGCRAVLQAAVGDDGAPLHGLRGLVLVDGAYLVPELLPDLAPERRRGLAEEAFARAAALYADVEPAERARHGIAQMFFDARFVPQRDAMIQRARALPATTARTLMPDFARWDVLYLEQALAQLRVPMLALVCTHMNAAHRRVQLDAHARTPWMQALERHVPQLTLERVPGAGHFPMIEQPEHVHTRIRAWLDALAPR